MNKHWNTVVLLMYYDNIYDAYSTCLFRLKMKMRKYRISIPNGDKSETYFFSLRFQFASLYLEF